MIMAALSLNSKKAQTFNNNSSRPNDLTNLSHGVLGFWGFVTFWLWEADGSSDAIKHPA